MIDLKNLQDIFRNYLKLAPLVFPIKDQNIHNIYYEFKFSPGRLFPPIIVFLLQHKQSNTSRLSVLENPVRYENNYSIYIYFFLNFKISYLLFSILIEENL